MYSRHTKSSSGGIGKGWPQAPVALAQQADHRLTARAHPSIAEIPREAWSRLFPHAVASWDYYRAIERMPSYGFTFGAVGAYAGDSLVGAVPMFQVNYRLDQPLGPAFQSIGNWLDRHAPSWITMPIVGLGSPLADECEIGLLPGMGETMRPAVLRCLLAGMEEHAAAIGTRVLVVKDVTDADRQWCGDDLAAAGFASVPSLPVAKLELPFASVDDYLASLSPKMRQDLRRKQRQAAAVRVEYRDDIAGLENEIDALCAATRSHRKASYDVFDEVPPGYFREVMAGAGGGARVQLLWIGDTLAGFNLFVVESERVIGKYVGLRYPLAREHNIYFVNWLEMVRYCIDHGVRELHVGQTSYALKARLGCKLHRSWIYHRHTGRVRGPLFRMLSPYAAFDRMDPDLRELGVAAPYAGAEREPLDS